MRVANVFWKSQNRCSNYPHFIFIDIYRRTYVIVHIRESCPNIYTNYSIELVYWGTQKRLPLPSCLQKQSFILICIMSICFRRIKKREKNHPKSLKYEFFFSSFGQPRKKRFQLNYFHINLYKVIFATIWSTSYY